MTYQPVDGKPFTVTMGLRALDLAHWIEIDENYQSEIFLKQKLLQQNHAQVFATIPRGFAGSAEALDLLKNHFTQYFPDHFDLCKFSGADLHPLEIASRNVQEDLVIMSKVDEQWVMTAASVCFPSRWDLTEKINKNLHEIHAPVPEYEERIGMATDTMFDKFTPELPMWRINWTILDSSDLHLPMSANQVRLDTKPLNPKDFGANTFLRVERQTLRALPMSKDVLFTIKTYVASLAQVDARDLHFRANLAKTLLSVSDETIGYKGWQPLWQNLQNWVNS